MAKRTLYRGQTSYVERVWVLNSSGNPVLGLTSTSGQLAAPTISSVTTASTGGTLPGGATNAYRVTAWSSTGESLWSAEVTVNVPAGTATNANTVNWGAITGAVNYSVYGRTVAGEGLIATVSVTNYTDTGSITPGRVAPTTNQSGLTLGYLRKGAGALVLAPLVAGTVGTYTNSGAAGSGGGWVEVDNLHAQGLYEVSLPDASVAAGSESVLVILQGGGSNMVGVPLEIELNQLNYQDAVRAGILALPNAAAGTAGGLDTPIAHAGTAQAGGANTITLAVGASATDSFYRGATLEIFSGTGAGQARVITSYVGATKVATLGRNWTVQPDNTSVYAIRSDVHAAVNDSLQVVASTVAGAVTTDVSATVGTIATSVSEIAGDTDTLITGQGAQATATALGNLQTTATEIAGDTDTIITNQGSQATATALATAQTGITEIAGDTDALMAGVAATATPANVATALANAGVSAARMQLLDAAVGTWSRSGNVITMHTVDNAHVFTATFDDITNPLTCTVVQVS